MKYIPLHLHSQHSILDSTLSIKDIVQRAKQFQLEAVALTDFCNMFGAVEFYKECKEAGIKPLIGIEIMVAPKSRLEKKKAYGMAAGYPLILIAKDRVGYQMLCRLSSIAYLEGFYYYPRIDRELLEQHAKGLICLSGPFYGKVGTLITDGNEEGLSEEIDFLQGLFKEDFYFEVARHRMSPATIKAHGVDQETWLYQKFQEVAEKQEKILSKLRSIGGIKCVATNDSRYLEREDFRAHEILMNVSSGEPCEIWEKDAYGNPTRRTLNPKRQTSYSHELFFKSPEQMRELFVDFPEAIDNTLEVANKVEFEFDLKRKFYPVYEPPTLAGKKVSQKERLAAAADYLKKLCEEGISKRYTPERLSKVQEKYPHRNPLDVVKERLALELEIIISKDMTDYLLIVYDFIAWAKSQKIPMGPGRGSGVGSIILYLIGVTDIEPLRFNLFFERFINPERASYPDIDVDICMDRRAEVIDYTIKKYGKDKVAQIITFGTMKAKMAVKDVGRVLSIPLAKVNMIAKLIPEDLGITIARALEIDPDLKKMYEEDEETKRVLDLSQKVEGSIRNTGSHAAGLIICGDPLTDHIPICISKDSDMVVTQFSMKPVEMVGMLKIDFLGLKTLTCIQRTVDAIHEYQGVDIDWVNLDFNDEATFALLNQGKTSGIFQLESSGMQDLLRQLHVDKFEEIIAVGALYRPGPMEMIPSFIQRKHGREAIVYDHEWLKDILEETYGIMVYQEQVMQIASRLAGYSLGEGDLLRRAMGKKDKDEMKRQREKFLKGALEKGITERVAMEIFDKVEKFASYGFNKSHAAAYGYLSYVTAYLKANHPKEWMAALMTCDMADISKVAKHIRESQSMHIKTLPPDINESHTTFVATGSGIRFALTAIKGIGSSVVDAIVHVRKNGPFKSLSEFLKRMDLGAVGKKATESLIQAGAFDFTGWSRSELAVYLAENYDGFVKQKKDEVKGILDFFGSRQGEETHVVRPKVLSEPSKLEVLSKEKALLGFYVTGHPLESFSDLLKKVGATTFEVLETLEDRALVKAAFVVESFQVRISQKSQKKFAILVISDGLERYELPVWPELYEQTGGLIEDNALLMGILQVDKAEEVLRLGCKGLFDLKTMDDTVLQKMEAIYAEEAGRNKFAQRQGYEKDKKKVVEMKNLKLTMDLDKVRMREFLRMKKIFETHPGSDSVDILFVSKEKHIATISIDSSSGTKISEALQKDLLALGSILKVE